MQVSVFAKFGTVFCSAFALFDLWYLRRTLFDSFCMAAKSPVVCVLWEIYQHCGKTREMCCSLIWKPRLNPSLQESDEVLSACLGTLGLRLLPTLFPITSSVVSCLPPQTREKRSARLGCRSCGSREKSKRRKVVQDPELERWWSGRWRSQQMVPLWAKSPRQTALHSLVVYSLSFITLPLNVY